MPDDNRGRVMWNIVIAVIILICLAMYLFRSAECESRGGVLVQSQWGYECVEKR